MVWRQRHHYEPRTSQVLFFSDIPERSELEPEPGRSLSLLVRTHAHALIFLTIPGNGINTLLPCGFIIIAACTILDGVLPLALAYRYASMALFPLDPAKLETPRTYINFDLLYRNGTKYTSSIPSDPRSPTRACAGLHERARQGLQYPHWPASFMAPYGSVPYNDRHLLVSPEVSMVAFSLYVRFTSVANSMFKFGCFFFISFSDLDIRSVSRAGSLALRIPEHGSDAMEIARIGSTIDIWALAVDSKADLPKLSYKTHSPVAFPSSAYSRRDTIPGSDCQALRVSQEPTTRSC